MFQTCMKAIHKYNNLKVIFAELGKKNWRKSIEKIMSYLSFFWGPIECNKLYRKYPISSKVSFRFLII